MSALVKLGVGKVHTTSLRQPALKADAELVGICESDRLLMAGTARGGVVSREERVIEQDTAERRSGIRDGIRGRCIVSTRKVPSRRIGIGVVLRKVGDRIAT